MALHPRGRRGGKHCPNHAPLVLTRGDPERCRRRGRLPAARGVCEGCRGGKFRPDHTPMVLTGETREMREIATPAGSPSAHKVLAKNANAAVDTRGGVCVPKTPVSPSPKTTAGGRPLLVGLPPSVPSTAPPETQRNAHAPCSWGIGASIPSRRRWPAALPAAAVCTLSRPIRTETQNTHPLLVGWVFVRSEPTAPAGGTVALSPIRRRRAAGRSHGRA